MFTSTNCRARQHHARSRAGLAQPCATKVRTFVLCVLCALSTSGLGCDLVRRTAVNTTASVFADAEAGTRGYFDWESAGHAAAAGIVQLEGGGRALLKSLGSRNQITAPKFDTAPLEQIRRMR